MKEEIIAGLIAKHVKDGMVVSFGTGEFEEHFLKALALHVEERGHEIEFIPSSMKLAALAAQLHLSIASINEREPDIAIEFVDLVDRGYNYIDNNSFSLIREKVIAQSAEEMIVIAKKQDFVSILHGPVAFEISPFGWKRTLLQLELLGSAAIRKQGEKNFKTESGNYLADVNTGNISSIEDLNFQAKEIPGVVETGLFAGLADRIILYDEQGRIEAKSRLGKQ